MKFKAIIVHKKLLIQCQLKAIFSLNLQNKITYYSRFMKEMALLCTFAVQKVVGCAHSGYQAPYIENHSLKTAHRQLLCGQREKGKTAVYSCISFFPLTTSGLLEAVVACACSSNVQCMGLDILSVQCSSTHFLDLKLHLVLYLWNPNTEGPQVSL